MRSSSWKRLIALALMIFMTVSLTNYKFSSETRLRTKPFKRPDHVFHTPPQRLNGMQEYCSCEILTARGPWGCRFRVCVSKRTEMLRSPLSSLYSYESCETSLISSFSFAPNLFYLPVRSSLKENFAIFRAPWGPSFQVPKTIGRKALFSYLIFSRREELKYFDRSNISIVTQLSMNRLDRYIQSSFLAFLNSWLEKTVSTWDGPISATIFVESLQQVGLLFFRNHSHFRWELHSREYCRTPRTHQYANFSTSILFFLRQQSPWIFTPSISWETLVVN